MTSLPPSNPDFDWVTTRNQCTVYQAFDQLQCDAKRNVQTRNDQLNQGPGSLRFIVEENSRDLFTVTRPDPHMEPFGRGVSVKFRIVEKTIRVEGFGIDGFNVTVGMNSDGHCIYKVEEEDLLRWQILHRALDELMFR